MGLCIKETRKHSFLLITSLCCGAIGIPSFFIGVSLMKYQPAFNVWAMPDAFYKHIQTGQWVYAGSKDNKGIFLGVRKSGTVVVAWYHNAKSHKSFREYVKTLHHYASGK
jgi:hypothetical protein